MSSATPLPFIQGPGIELKQLIDLRHLADGLDLFHHSRNRSTLGGGHRSVLRGRGMEFDEVRIYQPGDDVRSIDWRVTARTAKTHTKIFNEEKERPILLAVDQGPTMFFGSRVTYKSVMATELAALLGWAALNNNDKVGGIIFNQQRQVEIKPKRSKHALLSLLKSMAEFNQELFQEPAAPPLLGIHTVLERFRYIAKPGSAVFLISDFQDYDQEAEKILYFIKRHCDVYAICVADPLEQQLPSHPQLGVTDGTHKLQLNTSKPAWREQYQRQFDLRLSAMKESFDRLGLTHGLVWTSDHPRNALFTLLHQNTFRKKSNLHAS